MAEFDFIIVGAGTAGCLLADRLTKSGKHRVLLIEAGGSERRFMVRMPIGYGHSFYNPRVNWMYLDRPQEALAGRRSYLPRGKLLGGSSSINAMVFVRGQRRDFDDWRDCRQSRLGLGRCAAALQVVRKLSWQGDVPSAAPTARWTSSTWPAACIRYVRQLSRRCANRPALHRQPDYNGRQQEGVATYQITTSNGMRASSATAFLSPACDARQSRRW